MVLFSKWYHYERCKYVISECLNRVSAVFNLYSTTLISAGIGRMRHTSSHNGGLLNLIKICNHESANIQLINPLGFVKLDHSCHYTTININNSIQFYLILLAFSCLIKCLLQRRCDCSIEEHKAHKQFSFCIN